MLALAVVTDNERPDICGPCGGECCKRMPGAYSPHQFGADLVGVFELLASGVAAIDWYEGYGDDDYSPGYYLRAATKEKKGKVFDPSWGGRCVNLTTDGCSLKFDERPMECRSLKPMADGSCHIPDGMFGSNPSKRAVAEAWEPYFDLLEQIGREVEQQRSK